MHASSTPLNLSSSEHLMSYTQSCWTCHGMSAKYWTDGNYSWSSSKQGFGYATYNIIEFEWLINKNPGDEIANVTLNKYGGIDYDWGLFSASTDFVRRL